VLRVVGMYCLTLGGWMLFRVSTMQQAAGILSNILTNFHVGPEVGFIAAPVLTLTALLFAFHIVQERHDSDTVALAWRPVLRFGLYVFLIVTTATVGISPRPFIYFQF
jgi:hypothetical protein